MYVYVNMYIYMYVCKFDADMYKPTVWTHWERLGGMFIRSHIGYWQRPVRAVCMLEQGMTPPQHGPMLDILAQLGPHFRPQVPARAAICPDERFGVLQSSTCPGELHGKCEDGPCWQVAFWPGPQGFICYLAPLRSSAVRFLIVLNGLQDFLQQLHFIFSFGDLLCGVHAHWDQLNHTRHLCSHTSFDHHPGRAIVDGRGPGRANGRHCQAARAIR